MKLIKKWLFPLLTCLIVAAAAVLPPYVSQLRDARQFGQVHTELLAADALPACEPPSLLDRLALYVRWYSGEETIPSFQSPEEQYMETAGQFTQEALDRLAEGGVIPGWLTQNGLSLTSWSYILLWNPDSSIADQNPVSIWRISVEFGTKIWLGSLWMDVDAESGLPLHFNIYQDNMAQWLPYTPDDLQLRAEQYFALLELDVEPMDTSKNNLVLDYTIAGTHIGYSAEHNATMFTVQPFTIYDTYDSGPTDAEG